MIATGCGVAGLVRAIPSADPRKIGQYRDRNADLTPSAMRPGPGWCKRA